MKEKFLIAFLAIITFLSLFMLPSIHAITSDISYVNSMSTTLEITGYSVDGDVEKSGTSYSTVHDSSTGGVWDDRPYYSIGQYKWGSNYIVYRGFVQFDTSAIPDTATVTDAHLSLYGGQNWNQSQFNVQIQNGMPDYPNKPLVSGDYNKNHYSGNGGNLTARHWVTAAWNNITLSSDGKSWINLAGDTKFCLRTAEDIGNSAPNTFEFCDVYSSRYGYAPILSVTYTFEMWTEVGDSPYLNNVTTNYIVTSIDGALEGFFGFEDTFAFSTITGVTFYYEGKISNLASDNYVKVYDNTTYIGEIYPDSSTSYQWYSFDVTSYFKTYQEINTANIKLEFHRVFSSTASISVRRVYLSITGYY